MSTPELARHELRHETGCPHPAWFSAGRGARHRTQVTAAGCIELFGDRLRFVGEPLPAGTEVEVRIGQQFYCVTAAAIEAQERANEARAQAEREADRQLLNQLRARADAFNARLRLPVAWEPAIKDVLSGLQINSMGDGRNRATVEHIRLREPLHEGRLQRAAGAFLCSPAKGNWANQQAEWRVDGDGNRYAPAVTCQACLKLAARWIVDPDGSDIA